MNWLVSSKYDEFFGVSLESHSSTITPKKKFTSRFFVVGTYFPSWTDLLEQIFGLKLSFVTFFENGNWWALQKVRVHKLRLRFRRLEIPWPWLIRFVITMLKDVVESFYALLMIQKPRFISENVIVILVILFLFDCCLFLCSFSLLMDRFSMTDSKKFLPP